MYVDQDGGEFLVPKHQLLHYGYHLMDLNLSFSGFFFIFEN